MKKWLLFLFVLSSTVLLAATNPEFPKHKDIALPRVYEKKADDDGIFVVFTGPIAHAKLRYHDYVVFSTTTIDGKTVTVGALGRVLSVLR